MSKIMRSLKLLILMLGLNVYANTGTLTDIDGNIYQTVKIGDQWWMAENLKVIHYRNGDSIPNVTESSQWINLSTGAYCAYNNNEANTVTYGYLYNWFTVNDNRNIAPDGWHVPSNEEWDILEAYLGGYYFAGGKMKEAGTLHWSPPNVGATNESGFNGLPGGNRYFEDGNFYNIQDFGNWWTVTEAEGMQPNAYNKYLLYHHCRLNTNTYRMKNGYSIRCVKDSINTGSIQEMNGKTPKGFHLQQNYPNPFNPSTTVKYNLQKSSNVVLKIYNLFGQEIETLVNEFQIAGEHNITWQPNGLSSGVYIYRLQAGGFTDVRKMIFME